MELHLGAALLRFADTVSELLGRVSMLLLAVLVATVICEVVMRYVFGRPTIWSFDVSYMLNGSIFILALGYALKHDAHVRIDFLSSLMPERLQARIIGLTFLLGLLPISILLAKVAVGRAVTAYQTGAVEPVSVWAPKIWPFYSALALGLVVFVLQLLAEIYRYLFRGELHRDLDHTAH